MKYVYRKLMNISVKHNMYLKISPVVRGLKELRVKIFLFAVGSI